ncbi:flagellar hook-basal body complex protein FliE [Saccharophagus sp. K07]|jgi:flagellar hook-basal body complex protein FliE|uniref:flagellar hook-basal body complex protein FliE n=1 Tax=Saccharophagus sp. K07 TaxID=2283636 RepID=UPI001651DBD1|nr:flagellar hook-basal body complex protein FliE [Saccharophagus sp. K07]MBC6907102.1 flagellar hook-basal body complex protein FliE [Saccharophagus sp. K07]
MVDRVDINRLLLEMRALKAQSQAFGGVEKVGQSQIATQRPEQVNGPRFSDLFSQAVNKVNSVQQASNATSAAYMRGDPNVDITDVMIASQKSTVAFQAMTQVRNKVVEAYKDVMNMPI